MKNLKRRLISKTESTIFTIAFSALILALIVSLYLAQHFLISTARYWDLLRVERYMRLCQMALEAENRTTPIKESIQKLWDIGITIEALPADQQIPEPNPRYVPATESVEMWGYVRDDAGKPTAVIRISRHDINTRHTLRTVRLYTLLGAIGGTILIALTALVLHRTIIRRVRRICGKISAYLPQLTEKPTDDPLEQLERSVGELLKTQADTSAYSQRMLDSHTELVCVATPDGTIIDANAAYCRFFGKKREDLVGTSCLDLVNAAYRMDVVRQLQSLSRTNPEAEVVHSLTKADGSTAWVRWRAVAVLNPDGRTKEVISFRTDITPQVMVEERLKGLGRAFDQMQSLAETGSVTWDFAARRMQWTPETYRLLGVGASSPASLESLLEVVADADRERVRRLFTEAKESGRNFEHEFRAVLPDGSLRVLQSRAEVLADPKSKILNLLTCTLRDITSLRDAEAATKRELRFREAIEQSMGVGIVVSDHNGRNLLVNPAFCKMTGWSEKELRGISAPYPYWPREEIPVINKAFQLAIVGNTPPAGFELKFCRKDGTRFDVLVKVAPLLDNDDNQLGWLGAVTDISALQNARRELENSNERLRIAQDVAEFGIWDWDPSEDTLFWDRNSFAIFGHPEAKDSKAVWASSLGDHEREQLTYELRRLIAAGGSSGQDRLHVRWPDGSMHDILSTYVIIRDISGVATRVLGVNRDVTAQEEEELELRNTQERLAAALQGGYYGTFEHVIGTGDLNWNKTNYEINGIDPSITEPAALFAAWKAVSGDCFPTLMAEMSSLPATKTTHSYEFTARPPGKEPRHVRVSIFIERNNQGHPVKLVGITRRIDV